MGLYTFAILDTKRQKLETIDSVYTEFGYINCAPKFAVFVASSTIEPISVVKFNTETRTFELLYRRRNSGGFDANYVSIPNHTEFPTSKRLTACSILLRMLTSKVCPENGHLLLYSVTAGRRVLLRPNFNLGYNFGLPVDL
jgi:hypothetical protein